MSTSLTSPAVHSLDLDGAATYAPSSTHEIVNQDDAAPRKVDLFGVGVSVVDPALALATIMRWARNRRPAIVDFMGVHGLTHAQRHPEFKAQLNLFDMICCDGQPVRWALNRWYGAGIGERVYGPALTLAVCRAAAEQGVSVYFYGSRDEVLARLSERLTEQFPDLQVAGTEAPPFRALTTEEREATIARINGSGAGIVFIGLGCPKQEMFAAEHRDGIEGVQMCVGAAFDIHAGLAPMAPRWMQNAGLEWLYRLCREPRRLWKRYLVGNTQFVRMCLAKMLVGNG